MSPFDVPLVQFACPESVVQPCALVTILSNFLIQLMWSDDLQVPLQKGLAVTCGIVFPGILSFSTRSVL